MHEHFCSVTLEKIFGAPLTMTIDVGLLLCQTTYMQRVRFQSPRDVDLRSKFNLTFQGHLALLCLYPPEWAGQAHPGVIVFVQGRYKIVQSVCRYKAS